MARTAKTVEAKTTAKYTESHHRLTLTVKFADGTKFRLNGSAWRDSCSYDTSIKEFAEKIFRFCVALNEGENHGQRFSRLKNWFEQFETAQAAAASI